MAKKNKSSELRKKEEIRSKKQQRKLAMKANDKWARKKAAKKTDHESRGLFLVSSIFTQPGITIGDGVISYHGRSYGYAFSTMTCTSIYLNMAGVEAIIDLTQDKKSALDQFYKFTERVDPRVAERRELEENARRYREGGGRLNYF